MNLLIVDDEYYSVEGIHRKIRGAVPDFNLILRAYSLVQAQGCFQNHPIDVMITDIEMPKGNGLELAAWVKERFPQTICIFLTSFANFEYASTAIKLQSFDYLLKPVKEEDLIGCALRAVERVRQIQGEDEQKKQASHWRTAKTPLTERFWLELFQGIIPAEPSAIVRELTYRNLPSTLADRRYFPVLLRCDSLGDEPPWNRNLYEFALKNVLAEFLFSSDETPSILRIADFHYLIIRFDKQALENQAEGCEKALTACVHALPGHFQFFYNKTCDIEEIPGAAQSLFAYARNQISVQNHSGPISSFRGILRETSPLPAQRWGELLLARKAADLKQEVADFLSSLQRLPSSREDLIRFYHDFLQVVYSIMDKNGASAHQLFDSQMPEVPLENAYDSIEHMHIWLDQVLANFLACMDMVVGSQNAVQEVCRYIREHLSEELSRNELAATVFMSPHYLSHVFREKTGDSLTNYITEQRIQKAKELLLSSNQSIRDIALACGFQNISYFAKQFKRATGKTPQAYRKEP